MYLWDEKNVMTGGLQEPNPIFPRSSGSVFANSALVVI